MDREQEQNTTAVPQQENPVPEQPLQQENPVPEQQPKIEYGTPQGQPSQGGFWNSTPQQPYQQNPYQQNPYQQNPYQQNPYQQNPYQQNPYQQSPYQQNPYQQQNAQGFYAPQQTPEQRKAIYAAKNAKLFSILALVATFICSCLPLPSLVLSIMGLAKAKAASRVVRGSSDVTCAIVCSILALVFTLLAAFVAVFFWIGFFEAIAADF